MPNEREIAKTSSIMFDLNSKICDWKCYLMLCAAACWSCSSAQLRRNRKWCERASAELEIESKQKVFSSISFALAHSSSSAAARMLTPRVASSDAGRKTSLSTLHELSSIFNSTHAFTLFVIMSFPCSAAFIETKTECNIGTTKFLPTLFL